MGADTLVRFVENASLRNANKNNSSLFDVQTNPEAKAKLEKTAKTTNQVEDFGEFLARQFSIPTKATKERVANNNARRQVLYDAVVHRYGGKDNIPASVLKAMDIGKFSLKTINEREVVTSGKPLTDHRIRIVQSAIIAADKEVADIKKCTGVSRGQLMETLGLKATDELPPRLKTLLLVLAGRPDDVRSGDGITPQMAKDIVVLRTELLSLREKAADLERTGAGPGAAAGKTLEFGNFRLCLALDRMGKISVTLSPAGKSATGSKLDFDMLETNANKALDWIEADIAGHVALYGKDTAMALLKSAGGFRGDVFTDDSPRAREVGTKILASATGAKTAEFASCCTSFILKLAEKALKGQIGNASSLTKFVQALSTDRLTNDAETLKLYEQLNRSLETDAKGVAGKVKMSPAKALEAGEEAILAKMNLFKLKDLDDQIGKSTDEKEIFSLNFQKNAIKFKLSSGENRLTEQDLKDRAKVEKQAAAILRRREAAELRGAIADIISEADSCGVDFARLDKNQVPGARFGEAMKRNKSVFAKLIANPKKFDLLPGQIAEPLRSALKSQIADALPEDILPQGPFKLEDLRGVWEKQAGIPSKSTVLGREVDKFEIFIAGQLNALLDKLSEVKVVGGVRETGFAELERTILGAMDKGAEEIQKKVGEVFGTAQPGVAEKDEAKTPTAKDIVDKVVSDNQTLDDLVSSSMNDLRSGQGAFTKEVLSTYFESLEPEDRRTLFAAMLRFAPPPDPEDFDVKDLFTEEERKAYDAAEAKGDKEEMENLVAAKETAHKEELEGRQLGAMLKGTGPLLLKMLQGMPVPKDNRIMGIALEDVKSNLAPIPEKVVQANLLDVVERSKGEVKSIEVTKSLGAASVGQAFLCRVTLNKTDEQNRPVVKDVVVKMLRPDVKNRLAREKECFLTAADKISGMAETYRGQLERIMDELDLTVEARNALDGIRNYGDGTFSNLDSMRLDPIVPSTANVMILEKAPGTTLDRYMKDVRESIANACAPCVQSVDTTTGKVTYRYTGLDTYMEMRKALLERYTDLLQKRDMLESLSLKWVSEGLYGSGFYHGDLHAGNMMVDGETNKLTVIDFGNVTKLTKDQQSAIMKMMAAAAGGNGCENLFLEGYRSLLSPAGQSTLDRNLGAIKRLLAHIFADTVGGVSTTNEDVGQRIAAVLMQLQRLGLELPGPVHNFSQCQLRLQNAVDEVNGLMRTIRETMVGPLMANAEQVTGEDDPVGKLLRRVVPREDSENAAGLPDEFAEMYSDMVSEEDLIAYKTCKDKVKKMTDVTEKAIAEGEGWIAYLIRTNPLTASESLDAVLGCFPMSEAETEELMKNLVNGTVPSLDSYLDETYDVGGENMKKVGQRLKEAQDAYNKVKDSSAGKDAFEDETVKAKMKVLLDAYATARKHIGWVYCLMGGCDSMRSQLSGIPAAAALLDPKNPESEWSKLNIAYANALNSGSDATVKDFLDNQFFAFAKELDRLRTEADRPKKEAIYTELLRGGKIMKKTPQTFSKHVGDVVKANIGSSVWQLGLGNAIWYQDKLM